MANWLFDGVDLRTLPGLTLAPGTQLQTAVGRRIEPITVTSVDGVAVSQSPAVYDSRQVQIVVNVDGVTEVEVADRALDATAVLTSVKVLTRVHGTLSTTAPVLLQDLTESAPDNVDQHVTLTATYLIPGTFFAIPDVVASTTVPDSATATSYSRSWKNATAPMPGMGVLVAGPATYVKVTDINTGEWFEWTGTLAAGAYLSLDTAKGTARISITDVRGGFRTSPYGGRIQPNRNGTVNLSIIRRGGTGSFIMTFSPRYF